jgi:hypothetical protein
MAASSLTGYDELSNLCSNVISLWIGAQSIVRNHPYDMMPTSLGADSSPGGGISAEARHLQAVVEQLLSRTDSETSARVTVALSPRDNPSLPRGASSSSSRRRDTRWPCRAGEVPEGHPIAEMPLRQCGR